MDNHHPKIKDLMNPYLENSMDSSTSHGAAQQGWKTTQPLAKNAQIHPPKQAALHVGTARWATACTGSASTCAWAAHPKPGDIPDSFVDQCIDILGKGVIAQLQGGLDNLRGKKPNTSKTINVA
jgi:hypothetical protein